MTYDTDNLVLTNAEIYRKIEGKSRLNKSIYTALIERRSGKEINYTRILLILESTSFLGIFICDYLNYFVSGQ